MLYCPADIDSLFDDSRRSFIDFLADIFFFSPISIEVTFSAMNIARDVERRHVYAIDVSATPSPAKREGARQRWRYFIAEPPLHAAAAAAPAGRRRHGSPPLRCRCHAAASPMPPPLRRPAAYAAADAERLAFVLPLPPRRHTSATFAVATAVMPRCR